MIICDTGLLVGPVYANDAHHEACAGVFSEHGNELVVPSSVVIETCWLLGRVSPGHEPLLLGAIAAGSLVVEPLDPLDYGRAAELLTTYRDLRLGVVDATVVALAERLGVTTLATIDRRDFSVVRPAHTEAFTLLP